MNPKNKEADDHRAYLENILKTYGEGKNSVGEGSIEGTLDDQQFKIQADSWVEFSDQNGERLLLIFKEDESRINLEVKKTALTSSTYKFSIGDDFLFVFPDNVRPRWNADTATFSDLHFDSGRGRLEADVKANLWRGYPPNQETARLEAKLFVVKPVK